MNEVNIEKRNDKENAKKIVIVFHHDPDGLTSGALVLRALGLGNAENVVFVSHDPNEPFPEIFSDEVYVVDIAVTPKTWGSLQNLHASKILWIDHHSPFQHLETLKLPKNVQVVIDQSSPSAVLLVQKVFNLNDEASMKLVDLGTKADTWNITPLVKDWMDLDSAYSFKKRDKAPLIKLLAQGKLEIEGELKEILEEYRKDKEVAKKELSKNIVVKNIHGHLVAIGFYSKILSGSESADHILKETNSEIQIVIREGTGWMSFRRRKDSNINLIELAKIFGGGGHEYASGADLGRLVNSENFKEIAEEIFSKISSVL